MLLQLKIFFVNKYLNFDRKSYIKKGKFMMAEFAFCFSLFDCDFLWGLRLFMEENGAKVGRLYSQDGTVLENSVFVVKSGVEFFKTGLNDANI